MKARIFATLAVAVGSILALSAADASARSWGGSYRGYYGTRSWTYHRTPGNFSGNQAFQGYRGGGFNRNFSRGCSGGTCTSTATTTTKNGTTWSHNGTATYGNGAANWNRTATGRNGGTFQGSGGCANGAGCNSTRSVTAPSGNTYRAQRTTVPNGQGGYDHSATFTGPNGATASRSYNTGTGGVW